MWPLGHGFSSCACATTPKAEAMNATTVRRIITIHSSVAPTAFLAPCPISLLHGRKRKSLATGRARLVSHGRCARS
jgi:hypothetical protein